MLSIKEVFKRWLREGEYDLDNFKKGLLKKNNCITPHIHPNPELSLIKYHATCLFD